MSTLPAAARLPLTAAPADRPSVPHESIKATLPVRLAAFAGLSAFAAWRFAGIETRPPGARVVAITAISIIAAVTLSTIRVPEHPRFRSRAPAVAARVIVLIALLVVALVAAGVPAHLLRPARWSRLLGDAGHGLNVLSLTLWPYASGNSWARLDILSGLATALIAAAALAFWPTPRGGRAGAVTDAVQQLGALAVILTLYVIGVVNGSAQSSVIEGLVLLALVVAWLWLPGLRAGRVATALPWLAVAGAGAAALAGPLAGGQAWLDYRAWAVFGGGGPSTAFAWDQTYGPINWSRSDHVMFTVKALRPQLWKTTTLDRFDGLRFIRSRTDAAGYTDLPTPVNDHWYRFVSFSIQGLSSALVPIEQGTTVGVDFGHKLGHDRDGTVRTLGPALHSGDRYTVLSYVPSPTPAALRAAPRVFPAAYLRYTDFDLPDPVQSGLNLAATDPGTSSRFFTGRTVGAPAPGLAPAAVPGVQRRILNSPYGGMYRLGQRLASGSHSAYRIAVAIESYLKANYGYSERPPQRRYPLESFLLGDRIGYCQQFSGAMALMLRMNGIPARVAAGFRPGQYDAARTEFTVRAVDAHSWVEVYFTGIGWVPFDPTPPRTTTKPIVKAFPTERSASLQAALAATIGAAPHSARPDRGIAVAPPRRRQGSVPVAVIATAAAAVLLLLALACRWFVGGVRLRRSLQGDGELASRELVRALRALGYALPATVTLTQIERLVALHGGSAAARYVTLLRECRYGPAPETLATLRQRSRLRRGLTSHLGGFARVKGLWALPPGCARGGLHERSLHAGGL